MPASVPLVPAVDAAQLKPVIVVLPSVNPVLPGVLAVTVTVLVLALAVTVAPLHALIAAARFVASVDVLLLAAKVPQAVDPFEPVVAVPQENWLPLVGVPEIVTEPSAVAVTVTSLPDCEAVAPNAGGQELIAVAICAAGLPAPEL